MPNNLPASLISADPANDTDPSSVAGAGGNWPIDGDPLLGGGNQGTCQPGIGINTGDYGPKSTDWSPNERLDQDSDYIGGSLTDASATTVNAPQQTLFAVEYAAPDFNDQFSFVLNDDGAPLIPGAAPVSNPTVINNTGFDIPNGSWFWGVDENA